MTLFINGNNLNNPYWGVSRVAFELIRSLDELFTDPKKLEPFGDIVLLGRDIDCPLKDLSVIKYEHIRAPNMYLWENVAVLWRTKGHPIVGFQNRNPAFKRNCATMIHGLQILTQPSSYSRRAILEGKYLIPLIGKVHKTILTVSGYSADEIVKYSIAKRHKIRVVPNGIDHRERRDEGIGRAESSANLTPGRYIVAQASIKPHKNIATLMAAFRDPSLSNLKLVLFGGDNRESFSEMGIDVPENVTFVGMIGDNELRNLLINALCLVFPSLTEGFGLPPLEAMALGTPTIVSDRGAIPEVCGDASIIVDALDVQAWTRAINTLSCDEDLRAHYIKAGYARSALFTWRAAAHQLYDVILERHT
jgi:glycosyltransferase involved in cell wall biosynthesis